MVVRTLEEANTAALRYAEQGGNVSQPAAGFWKTFFKSDGLYVIDDANAVTKPFVTQDTGDQNFMGDVAIGYANNPRAAVDIVGDLQQFYSTTTRTGNGVDLYGYWEPSAGGSGSPRALYALSEWDHATNNLTSGYIGVIETEINITQAGNGPIRNHNIINKNFGSGTIATVAGLYVETTVNSGGGTITDDYGIYVEDLTVATNNYPIYTNAGNIVFNAANGAGNVTVGGTSVSVNYDLGLVGDGVLMLKETSTPTADTNYGKVYTKAVNQLYFQDGAGTEHLLHGPAFSSIWFNGATTAMTISTVNTLTKIDTFENVGSEDDQSIATGSAATNDITLDASLGAGNYSIGHSSSLTIAGGANKLAVIVPGVTLATAKDITDVTDDTVTPIVITSVAHGLANGDMVRIVDVVGNTAANGDFRIDNVAADTFEIIDLDNGATTGNGDYNEGAPTGDITIVFPGGVASSRVVSGADLGVLANSCLLSFAAGDVIGLYAANVVDTNNFNIISVNLTMNREDI